MKKKEQTEGRKRVGKFELFHPANLQRQTDSYGYSFSMGKYSVILMAAVAGAIGCGVLFCLHWYLILLVVSACAMALPRLILDGYKQMYEHKQFLDVSDYIEQMLYSFRLNQKILLSLRDTQTLFASGRMHQMIGASMDYIEQGTYQRDLYREALEIIEQAYPTNRLLAVHEYLRTVESNGGICGDGIELLLQDKAVWADNVILLQEEKRASQYTIVDHPVTQITTTLYLILNIKIFCQANRQLAKSWLKVENLEQEKIFQYFQMVSSFEEQKEGRKSLFFGGIFLAGASFAGLLGNLIVAFPVAGMGIFILYQHKIGYRVAYDKVVREINRVFPSWLMEMALLLQGNNVQVSIEKTIDHAAAVLRTDLQKLSDNLKRTPDAIEPYLEFLGMFQLSSVLSSMKMLYAISESGSGDAQAQIRILVQRNSKMMDKSEKLSNEKSLAGINGVFYLPQVTVSVQTMVNMVVFMLVFLGQMRL